jgi:hypothetical protein
MAILILALMGQRPGSGAFYRLAAALKGRNKVLGSRWTLVDAGSVVFIAPFHGLRTGKRWNFLIAENFLVRAE